MSSAEYGRLTLEEHRAFVRWMIDEVEGNPHRLAAPPSPPRKSTREEIRAFFKGEGTAVTVDSGRG